MKYPTIVVIVPVLAIIMLIVAALIPGPITIMVAMVLSLIMIITQTLAVLKGDPNEMKSEDEIPEP